jgi:hypothetical protein
VIQNQMPKGGIQDLVQQVITWASANGPAPNANLVENVVTLLQRAGKIQWEPPNERVLMAFSTEQLRLAADQIDAYRMLARAGADLSNSPNVVAVHGKKLGYIWWTSRDVLLAIDTNAVDLDWMTYPEFHAAYPEDGPFELDEDDD